MAIHESGANGYSNAEIIMSKKDSSVDDMFKSFQLYGKDNRGQNM